MAIRDTIDANITTNGVNAITGAVMRTTLKAMVTDYEADVADEATARGAADTALQTAVAGKYTKPSGGIPKTDLASGVQTSLGKADTALQSVPNTYRTAAAQDVIDNGKQATLVSGTNIKTINNQSVLGSGNLDVGSDIEVKQTTGQSTTAVMSQKAVTDELDERAKIDGVYESMVVGSAMAIAGNTPTTNEFTFRTTAGTKDVGSAIAQIKKMRGKSLVWNQLVGADTASVTIPSGHKYFFKDTTNNTESVFTSDGNPISVVGGSDMVIDLTKLAAGFPSGSEASLFRALFPLPYYPYNAGQVVHFLPTGIKTTGFNQWDEQWELGSLDISGQPGVDANYWRSKNFIDVVSGQTYCFYTSNKQYFYVATYDANGNCINARAVSAQEVNAGNYYTFNVGSANKIKFFCGGTGVYQAPDKVCINLSHSGTRNGQYEAHQEAHTLPLNFKVNNQSVQFKSVGTAKDEVVVDADGYARKYIKRVGEVDLGSLNWEVSDDVFLNRTDLGAAYPNGLDALGKVANAICSIYTSVSYNTIYDGTTRNMVLSLLKLSSSIFNRVRNTSYTTAAAFKTAMSGVMLYFELATPVEVTFDTPVYINYNESDWGTEMLLPQNTTTPTTTPTDMDIVYPINAVDTLNNLNRNFVSMGGQSDASQMKVLLEALKTAQIISAYTIGDYNATTGTRPIQVTKQA